jgi:hypothetical protein
MLDIGDVTLPKRQYKLNERMSKKKIQLKPGFEGIQMYTVSTLTQV